MKYTSTNKVTINLTPWFDTGYRLTKLQISEQLGGMIASGTVDMDCDGSSAAIELVTTQYTGTLSIEKEGGNIYEMDIWITTRNYYKNAVSLGFLCLPGKDFYTTLMSMEYSDIDSAIESLFPGNQDIRCETDVDTLVLYQNCETAHSLCTKLCQSYKRQSVFSFGFDGLMIKELVGIASNGESDPYWEAVGGVDISQIDSYRLDYNNRLYTIPIDPWTTDNTYEQDYTEFYPVNSRIIKNYSDYSIVGTDYYTLMENYLYNSRFYQEDLYSSFRVVSLDLPRYKIGDIVTFKQVRDDLPFTKYLVRSNELFISLEGSKYVDFGGRHFSWTSKFIGIEENSEVMPETDPTD